MLCNVNKQLGLLKVLYPVLGLQVLNALLLVAERGGEGYYEPWQWHVDAPPLLVRVGG